MLMRVVEQRKVWRVRGSEGRPFEASLISTARRDPGSLVAAGTFRGDLRSRLSPITVVIPPLRERPEDVEPLARHFASLLGRVGSGDDRAPRLSDAAIALLKKCEWSDNVQHLWKVLARAFAHCDGEIRIEHFDVEGLKADRAGRNKDPFAPLPGELMTLTPLELAERDQIQEAIEGTNLSDLVRRLGISRRTLISKLDRYGIPIPATQPPRHG
jgi:DNA-binding NtrC family response regulator